MSDPAVGLEFACTVMHRIKSALDDLVANLPVDVPTDDWGLHQLCLSLEHIADGLFMDTMQCESVLTEYRCNRDRDLDAPSDVTLPSPPTSPGDAMLHCSENIDDHWAVDWNKPSDASSSDDMLGAFGYSSSSEGVEYDPEDSDNTD